MSLEHKIRKDRERERKEKERARGVCVCVCVCVCTRYKNDEAEMIPAPHMMPDPFPHA